MIFEETKSGLTRLSDAVKLSLATCAATTEELLAEFRKHSAAYRQMQDLAEKIFAERSDRNYMKELEDLAAKMPGAVMIHHHNFLSSSTAKC